MKKFSLSLIVALALVFVLPATGDRRGPPTIHPGWPVLESGTYLAAPVIADINGDGSRDYVSLSHTGLWVYNEDGTPQAGWPRDLPFSNRVMHFSVGDVDADGMLEIAAGTEYQDIYVLNYDGTVKEGWPVQIPANVNAPPSLGDIDNDGDLEIVSVRYAFHHDGTMVDGWPPATGSPIENDCTAALADIDGDGDLEVFQAGWWEVYAWHHDGSAVAGWPVPIDSSPEDGLAVGDIDNDGDYEIVAATYGSKPSLVYAWHHDGTVVAGWPISLDDYFQTCPSIGDIDGDGDLEIFQSARADKLMYAWHHDGSEVAGWPVYLDSYQLICSPSIGDLDGDGVVEILTCYGYCYTPTSGNICALHPDGSVVPGWPIDLDHVLYETVSIGDIDKDGKTEIGKGLTDGAFVWDIEGTFDEANIQWATFMHDFRRTGCIDTPIYEDSQFNPPYVDIKCNGEDSGVVVNSGENVTLTIDAHAGYEAWTRGDAWILLRNNQTGNIFTCGPQDNPIWIYGKHNVYYSGPLFDHVATVLDRPLAAGNYEAFLAIDLLPDGSFNPPYLWNQDVVDFVVQ